MKQVGEIDINNIPIEGVRTVLLSLPDFTNDISVIITTNVTAISGINNPY